MQLIGTYFDRKVYWLDYQKLSIEFDRFPDKDWVCLCIANQEPDLETFDKFVRSAIANRVLEFKGHGQFGEKLHDLFDETIARMETMEACHEIDVVTTWHNDQSLADTFWDCFFGTYLPATADIDNIKIICTDLDGMDRSDELRKYIKEYELGWLPSENVKHEVWQAPEGLTTLCLADENGDDCRKILEPGSKLIHEFYACSHFDAMTIYYKFMGWGTYTTEFEIDKKPYNKKLAH